jgi:hypothetical protein
LHSANRSSGTPAKHRRRAGRLIGWRAWGRVYLLDSGLHLRPNLKKLILCAVILVAKRSGTAAVVTLLTGRRDVYARLRRNRFLVFPFLGRALA